MKKVLLLGFVLAICVLAFPQGVLADNGPRDVTIDATYGTATDFNAVKNTATIPDTWNLKPDDDNWIDDGIVFTLTTQAKEWDVKADSDNSGYMHGSQGNLQSTFLVDTYGEGGYVAPTAGAIIRHGGPSNENQDWNADIEQPVKGDDMGSSTAWTITITFTCTAGF